MPLDGLVWHAEGMKKLEVLILHVLILVRRDLPIREKPVEIARALAIEAELDGRADERRDDPGLEIHLQVDHDVEAAVGELSANVGEGAPALGAIEQHQL